ncbi:acyltransferase [Microbulbifer sp. SAOS-129_SWC]|uniref:acyltransferase family protein n=1 Tax=Microbulbifer sp. SAOS-129_SWC TaxID=3145235 RepID=UPI0032162323
MSYPRSAQRLYGLDSLRALAIIVVLIYHYRVVVSREPLFGFMSELGWAGVDLFFVLSGYLIGNQVLGALARNEDFSLRRFYARRFFRTLPNYYVVLALCLLVPALNGKDTAPLWSFLSFTQNLAMRPGETFTHSWSLCIEEQFYLLFPLAALLLLRRFRSPLAGWVVLAVGSLAAMALRMVMLERHGGADIGALDYYQYIYYTSVTRFDELLPGIAIALLKNFHRDTFARLLEHGQKLLLVGIALVAFAFYGFQNYWYRGGIGVDTFWTTCGYSLLTWGFALLVLSALSPKSWLHRARIPGAASIAVWSYALYLIHKPLFKLLKEPVGDAGFSVDGYAGMAIILAVSITAGWLLFRTVETPFMRMRSRLVPSNVRAPAPVTAAVSG